MIHNKRNMICKKVPYGSGLQKGQFVTFARCTGYNVAMIGPNVSKACFLAFQRHLKQHNIDKRRDDGDEIYYLALSTKDAEERNICYAMDKTSFYEHFSEIPKKYPEANIFSIREGRND